MSDKKTATPYDDVFKTLLVKCSRLVIAFVNQIFHKCYSLTENVNFENTEQLHIHTNGEQSKRFVDCTFTIGTNSQKRYHIECQTNFDPDMIIRMFEYDTFIAQEHCEKDNDIIVFRFPESAVLYLRKDRRIKDKISVILELSGDKRIPHEIPVVKIWDYSLEALVDNGLYILIPFYFFNCQKEIESIKNEDEASKLVLKILEKIADLIKIEEDEGRLSSIEALTIVEGLMKVTQNVFSRYKGIAEGVKTMGGNVYTTIAEKIIDENNMRVTKAYLEIALNSGFARDKIIHDLMKLCGIPHDKATALYEACSIEEIA